MRKLFFTLAVSLLLLPSLALAADIIENPDAPTEGTANTSIYSSGLTSGAKAAYPTGVPGADLGRLIGTLIAGVLSVLAVIFLVLLIYAGILWMTAAGNEDQVKKAQGILRNSVIGLIIILASYSISFFVLSYLGT